MKMKCLLLSGILTCSLLVTTAYAQEPDIADIPNTGEQLIEKLEKETFDSEEIQQNQDGSTTELENATIQIPDTSEELITIENFENSEHVETGMGIAVTNPTKAIVEDDIIYYLDESENYSANIQVSEDSIRQSFIIGSQDSPEEYEIEIQIPENGYMAFAEFAGKKDGSIVVYDGNSEPVAAIDIPWATDSNGKDIDTFYRIEGNKLIQFVNHKKIDTAYPVVADPVLTFSSYFSSGTWISRSGTISLSLTPKLITRTQAGGILGWAKVKSKFSSSKNWKNADGLYDQYICHNLFAILKSPWNLEPSRPNVSLAATVAKACNP